MTTEQYQTVLFCLKTKHRPNMFRLNDIPSLNLKCPLRFHTTLYWFTDVSKRVYVWYYRTECEFWEFCKHVGDYQAFN